MSKKMIISMLAVFFSIGLCSMAFAGDPDRGHEVFAFDSGMTGHSMNVSATDSAATKDHRDSADIDSDQAEMGGKSAPCAVVIAKAASVTDVNSECRSQFRDQYGS
jgi:hypothetical protein